MAADDRVQVSANRNAIPDFPVEWDTAGVAVQQGARRMGPRERRDREADPLRRRSSTGVTFRLLNNMRVLKVQMKAVQGDEQELPAPRLTTPTAARTTPLAAARPRRWEPQGARTHYNERRTNHEHDQPRVGRAGRDGWMGPGGPLRWLTTMSRGPADGLDHAPHLGRRRDRDRGLLNTHVRDNLKAIGEPWTAYTPSLTNWVLGNGTLVGRELVAGKLIHFNISLTVGSTTTTVGNLGFNLPASPRGSVTGTPVGQAQLFDTSGSSRRLWAAVWDSSASAAQIRDDTYTAVSAASPWTWATGDQVLINGTYEAA